MGRTGSILLANLCQNAIFHQKIFSRYQVVVEVKHTHTFNEDIKTWADIILTTKRDIREQMGSVKRYLKKHRDKERQFYVPELSESDIHGGFNRLTRPPWAPERKRFINDYSVQSVETVTRAQIVPEKPATDDPDAWSEALERFQARALRADRPWASHSWKPRVPPSRLRVVCNDISQEIDSALKIYKDWKPYVKAEFVLEDWFTNPIKYITQLSTVFDFSFTNDESMELKNSYFNVNKAHYQGVPHITKKDKLVNYKDTLTAEEIETIYHLFDTKYSDVRNNHLYIEEYTTRKEETC